MVNQYRTRVVGLWIMDDGKALRLDVRPEDAALISSEAAMRKVLGLMAQT